MPTRATETTQNGGFGGAAKDVADHATRLANLVKELASVELKRKLSTLGVGIGLTVGAALFALFGLGFLLAGAAAAIALELPWWAALLVTAGGLFLLAALLGLLGVRSIKKATPPVPEQAIEEARLTTAAIKSDGS
jgi:Putative Actinobacterial Holin-X, holin superfamily III